MSQSQPNAVKRQPERTTSSTLAEIAALAGMMVLFLNLFAPHGGWAAFGLGLVILAVFLKLPSQTASKMPETPQRKPRNPL